MPPVLALAAPPGGVSVVLPSTITRWRMLPMPTLNKPSSVTCRDETWPASRPGAVELVLRAERIEDADLRATGTGDCGSTEVLRLLMASESSRRVN